MSEEVIKILDNLGEKFGIAIDWTSENIAPYLTELYERAERYLIIDSIVTLVICAALFTASLFAIIKITKCVSRDAKIGTRTIWFDRFYDYSSVFSVICRVAAGFIMVITAILIPFTISRLIKSIYIPEMMIIQMLEM